MTSRFNQDVRADQIGLWWALQKIGKSMKLSAGGLQNIMKS